MSEVFGRGRVLWERAYSALDSFCNYLNYQGKGRESPISRSSSGIDCFVTNIFPDPYKLMNAYERGIEREERRYRTIV